MTRTAATGPTRVVTAAGRSAAAGTWAAIRRYPATWWVTVLTAVVGGAQLLSGSVVGDLQRDRGLLEAGQWWRIVTPMFVQPSGINQYVFNLIGSVLVGVAVERQVSAGRWLGIYFGAGLAGIIASYLWFPSQTGGGSSDGVAGLIGATVILWWLTRTEPWWPGYLYGAFFAAYLTALAAVGPITATVVGGLSIGILTTVRRRGPASRLRPLICALIAAAAVTLTILRDDHGIGLMAGILIGLAVRLSPGQPRPRSDAAHIPGGGPCDDQRRRATDAAPTHPTDLAPGRSDRRLTFDDEPDLDGSPGPPRPA